MGALRLGLSSRIPGFFFGVKHRCGLPFSERTGGSRADFVEAACGVFQTASEVLLGGGAEGFRVVDARTGLRFAACSFAVHSRGDLLGVLHGLAAASGVLLAGMVFGDGGGLVGYSRGTRVERH